MDIKDIAKLNEKSCSNFDRPLKHIYFLNDQIQEHLVDIDRLREEHNQEIVAETVDLALLAMMHAFAHGANEDIFARRMAKFTQEFQQPRAKAAVKTQSSYTGDVVMLKLSDL
ncbi:hypothetical protein HZB02_00350 [Candidatus Woesearchaeota archaeon]|nr:hypothetical protein [Candidatus Woesearchaeota archaeon]